jgi:hypothetical protein
LLDYWLLQDGEDSPLVVASDEAYALADAMLEARKVKP